jgi:glycine/D-amino acid oxidase-like deaminating enzyme
VTPGEIKERWSPVNTDGIVGGFWFPHDGQVNPADVTMAYAKGAERRRAHRREPAGYQDHRRERRLSA